MCYRGGRGVVPPDESTSIRNCGDAYDGIRLDQTMAKFREWPRDMVMQMRLWHIGVAEPPCEPRQINASKISNPPTPPGRMIVKFCGWPYRVADHGNPCHVREALPVTISFVVRWRSTAELTPLRSVRPSYRFLRPRSRENLSPAGTSHFPRPWVGHVRRTAPPDRQHGDESLHP